LKQEAYNIFNKEGVGRQIGEELGRLGGKKKPGARGVWQSKSSKAIGGDYGHTGITTLQPPHKK